MLYCPACRSRNIFLIAGGCLGTIYRCKNCGYQGTFVIDMRDGDPQPKPGSGS
jgi:transposase-like protein